MASTQPPTFGQLLKRYRIAAGLTQEALGERAGLSARGISDMERGLRRAPYRDSITRLAQALQLADADRMHFETAARRQSAPTLRNMPGFLTNTLASLSEVSGQPIGGFLGATPASPLVGREAELGAIAVALEAVASGQGRLLTLSGDPGVGKTRVAQEITVRARAQGFSVITGRCYEPQQSVAYYPFLEALIKAAGSTPHGWDQLAMRWPEVARLLPEHAASTAIPVELNDRSTQQRLFWQVTGFLGALSEAVPLALLMDDLHWADSSSLDLLQHLARHTRERRVLIVGTYRDFEATGLLASALHDLSRDELVDRLVVRPLAPDETTTLIGATLKASEGAEASTASVSPHLAQLIQQHSEGNAFFTRQFTRALQEQDQLRFEDGQWRLSTSTPLPLPESIRAVVVQRLTRLTPRTQDVLREASVLGQVLAFDDLQKMSARSEQEVDEALEEAARAGIVREGEPDRYHFNHALTLDTLSANLSTRRKRRLHRAAADAIEQAPDHERRTAELAYHLIAADEGARALPYALLAGDEAEAVYAHVEAEEYYRAAAALASDLHEQEQASQAREKLGMVLSLQGRNDEAIALLEQALRTYGAQGNELAELRSAAELLEIQSLYGRKMADEAIARAQVILARFEPPDPSVLTPALAYGLASVYRGLALVYFGSGAREEQVRAARRAVEFARVAGDDAQLAWALHRLYATGLVPGSLTVGQEIVTLAERSGQSMIAVFAHHMLGNLYAQEGDFARGMAHMEQSVAVAEQRQDLVQVAWRLDSLTELLFYTGDWQRMRETYARAASIRQEADPTGLTWQAAVMSFRPGKLALLEGREAEGRRLLEQATKRVREVGTTTFFEGATFLLAEADLLAGHAEAVRARLTTLLQGSEQLIEEETVTASILLAWAEGVLGQFNHAGDRVASALAIAKPLYLVDGLRIQGLLATMQGRWKVATAALDDTLERTRAMAYPYGEAKALWVYGRLEAARSDRAAARIRFKQALAICNRLGEGLYRKRIECDLRALAQKG